MPRCHGPLALLGKHCFAEELRDSANRFERDANTVRKIMARRACKIYAIVICLILVVLAYIIIPLIA